MIPNFKDSFSLVFKNEVFAVVSTAMCTAANSQNYYKSVFYATTILFHLLLLSHFPDLFRRLLKRSFFKKKNTISLHVHLLYGRKKRLVIFFRWLSCWNPGPSSLLSSSACSCVSGHLLTPIRRNQRIPEMTLLRRNSPNTTPRWDTTSTSSRDNGEKDTLCVSDKCTCNYA